MPSPPRLLLPKTAVFVTTRIQEGLPLVPALFMTKILEGILARAQFIYPIVISGFKFMSNHLHMVLVVKNPDDIVGFMDRIKTESGHAVNRLLGRRCRTVWQKRYDSPVLLTPGDVVRKLVYLYTNAQSANIVSTIDEYPNVNSWKMLVTGQYQKVCKWIQRPMIQKLENTNLSVPEQEALATALLSLAKKSHTLTICPDAWFACFDITTPEEISEYRRQVIAGVREKETALTETRTAEGKSVMGPERLMQQPIDTPYTPKTFGRRMWCICQNVELKIAFILMVKSLISHARKVLERWRVGDMTVKYPPGLFPPSMPKICNMMPCEFA